MMEEMPFHTLFVIMSFGLVISRVWDLNKEKLENLLGLRGRVKRHEPFPSQCVSLIILYYGGFCCNFLRPYPFGLEPVFCMSCLAAGRFLLFSCFFYFPFFVFH